MKIGTRYSPVSIEDSGRLKSHDQNVKVLNTLALLLGCYSDFFLELPDGKRPDVLRYNAKKKRLFVGDAKNTETPRNKNTQRRLLSYLLWLAAYVSKPGRQAIFAICFRNPSDLEGWISTIQNLAKLASVELRSVRSDQVDSETNLVWFSVAS